MNLAVAVEPPSPSQYTPIQFPKTLDNIQIPNTVALRNLNSTTQDINEPYFDRHMERLCKCIERADAVFGMVYHWNHLDVLECLKKKSAQIILDKDNLRNPSWYNGLKCEHSVHEVLHNYGLCNINHFEYPMDPYWLGHYDPIRVANTNPDEPTAHMHHKLMVFCVFNSTGKLEAKAVWFGSANWTYNADKSFENSNISTDTEVVVKYLQEYKRIFDISSNINSLSRRRLKYSSNHFAA